MIDTSISRRKMLSTQLWLLFAVCALGIPLAGAASSAGKSTGKAAGKPATWHAATAEELRALIPARAPVVSERIETEFRTASGIIDSNGRSIVGVVLITAGYSAEGKYSHYFATQLPLKIGTLLLPPGQYLMGWVRASDSLQVTFYQAQSGKVLGQVEATRNSSITRVESFRIWPPDKSLIQFGRFTFSYALGQD